MRVHVSHKMHTLKLSFIYLFISPFCAGSSASVFWKLNDGLSEKTVLLICRRAIDRQLSQFTTSQAAPQSTADLEGDMVGLSINSQGRRVRSLARSLPLSLLVLLLPQTASALNGCKPISPLIGFLSLAEKKRAGLALR